MYLVYALFLYDSSIIRTFLLVTLHGIVTLAIFGVSIWVMANESFQNRSTCGSHNVHVFVFAVSGVLTSPESFQIISQTCPCSLGARVICVTRHTLGLLATWWEKIHSHQLTVSPEIDRKLALALIGPLTTLFFKQR